MTFFKMIFSLVRYLIIAFLSILLVSFILNENHLAIAPLILLIFILTNWFKSLVMSRITKRDFVTFLVRVVCIPILMCFSFLINDRYDTERAIDAGYSSLDEYRDHLEKIRKEQKDEEERKKMAAEIQAERERLVEEEKIRLEFERELLEELTESEDLLNEDNEKLLNEYYKRYSMYQNGAYAQVAHF